MKHLATNENIEMNSTRAASAASSRCVKQKLVQLLFGKKCSMMGRAAHKKLDNAAYSHKDLRRAFLKRIHDIHPDKRHVVNTAEGAAKGGDSQLCTDHDEFVELQTAWSDYDQLAKMMTKVGSGDSDANFTKFGVGCSFSDNPEEQRVRAEIMDQASRGWFASGLVPEQLASSNKSKIGPANLRSSVLCDDSMFVEMDTSSEGLANDASNPGTNRKSLIDISSYMRKKNDIN